MSGKSTSKRRILAGVCAAAILSALLVAWGCGTDYDTPTSVNSWNGHPQILTSTPNALVDNVAVKAWVDNGLVNAAADERVVIIEVGASQSAWDNCHIPGAQFLNSSTSLLAARLEGVDTNTAMVLAGGQMDNLIQSMGIDGRTTIVFTFKKGDNYIYATRAYFTFRYWGFPKERLKVLDGGNGAYERAYGTANMEGLGAGIATFPSITRSSFSVYNNGTLRDDLRASVGEMIAAVKDNAANVAFVDDRASFNIFTGVAGATSIGSKKAVLEGRIRGARWITPANYGFAGGSVDGFADNVNYMFKPLAEIEAILAANGIDETKKVYSYCTTGIQGTAAFFVLDGILGWDAVLYDGSWSQWGTYAAATGHNASLHPNSPWGIDNLVVAGPVAGPTTGPTYLDNSASVYTFSPVNQFLPVNDPRMNQIEAADRAYILTPPAGTAGGTGGGSGSGGGC